jgi:hypothetical protein
VRTQLAISEFWEPRSWHRSVLVKLTKIQARKRLVDTWQEVDVDSQ